MDGRDLSEQFLNYEKSQMLSCLFSMVFVVNAWREVPIFIDNMLGNDSFDGLNQVAFFARDRLCLPADLARFQTTPFRSLSRINVFIANYSATYDQSGFCWCRVCLCVRRC